MRILEKLINGLTYVQCHNDLQKAVVKLRDHYGVDHVVYHSINSTGEQHAALTYDPAWVQRYVEKDYVRIDPVVRHCFRGFVPVSWNEIEWSGRVARAFLGEAIDAGVANQGLSVPIRGPSGQFALFTIGMRADDDRWAQFSGANMAELLLVAHYLNQRALELDRGSDLVPSVALSPREVDALSLLASGASRARAAEFLRISEHTLRVYIESARLKLGAQNTTHAVALALSRGLIIL